MIDLPVPTTPNDAPRHARLAGFIVASGVAIAVVAIERLTLHTWITALGLVIGPYLGWCLGPDAATFRRPARTVVEMAVVATVIGAVLVAMLMVLTTPSEASPELATQLAPIIVIAMFGLLIYGLPALFVTTLCALTWYVMVHRLMARGRS